ncbi:MAG: mycothiol synthase [Acidimicrobiales bacterium]
MHHVQVKRRMGEADIAEVSALVNAVAHADGHRPLGEHKWLDLVHGGRKGFSGFVARDGARGPLVGYAQLSHGHRTWGVEMVVVPERRGPDQCVSDDLLAAALSEIGRQGGGHVHLWVPKPTPQWDATAEACGLARGRDLYQMRRPLPIDDPTPRVAVRSFEIGADEAAWLEVNNRAFSSHPEQGDWTLDTLLERQAEPWFDPEGLLLHERDGRLAGSCWTKIHDFDDPPVGEIYVISVDPDLQGLGLGRALVLAGLDHLESAGLGTAMLYVDGSSEPALSLYRSLGFDIDHVDRAYTGDVPSAR